MSKLVSQEKHSRAFVKGISWRVVATCDTIFLSWLITGAIKNAFKIGVIEVFTKLLLFYLHERMWMRMRIGIKEINGELKEMQWRSFVKGISWRFFGTLDTIIIAFFVTGNITNALAIGGAEVLTKVGLFWLHERAWLKVEWGRKVEFDPVEVSNGYIGAHISENETMKVLHADTV